MQTHADADPGRARCVQCTHGGPRPGLAGVGERQYRSGLYSIVYIHLEKDRVRSV